MVDDYVFSYLPAGRDLLRARDLSALGQKPVVMAGPNFNLRSADGLAAEAGVRGVASSVRTAQSIRFAALPGAAAEGLEVAEILGVEPLLGDRALKGVLRSLKSPAVLHLATHGFVLPSATSGKDAPTGLLARYQLSNPLLRCGVALAGANSWSEGLSVPIAAEDGVLNGEDVALLDLRGTQLVVLSACETGLGELHAAEGVLGLTRSFLLAGAETVIASLWRVPDEITRLLMRELYLHLLNGVPRVDALRKARLSVKRCSPDPRSWGGFVCIGNAGPLVRSW